MYLRVLNGCEESGFHQIPLYSLWDVYASWRRILLFILSALIPLDLRANGVVYLVFIVLRLVFFGFIFLWPLYVICEEHKPVIWKWSSNFVDIRDTFFAFIFVCKMTKVWHHFWKIYLTRRRSRCQKIDTRRDEKSVIVWQKTLSAEFLLIKVFEKNI